MNHCIKYIYNYYYCSLMFTRMTSASLYLYFNGVAISQNIFGILEPLFENYLWQQFRV